MSYSLALSSPDVPQHNPTPLSSPLHSSSDHTLQTILNNAPQHPLIITNYHMITHAKDGIVKKESFFVSHAH